ncbi:MAG: EAL domain-containing protein [Halofilum sp. (in: g-proteobacteria)]
MIRDRFQRKLTLFFTALVAVIQLATLVLVAYAISQNVRQQVERELAVGSRVTDELLAVRSDRLLRSVHVLASDFGFKEAAATGDRPTVRSVLGNHGARIEADMGALLDLGGAVQASTLDALPPDSSFPLPELRAQAVENGEAVGFGLIGSQAYQLVIVPVRAPEIIAWVCLGFAVHDQLAAELASLTGVDVSFELRSGRESRIVGSTLNASPAVAAVPAASVGNARVSVIETDSARVLATANHLASGDDYDLQAILQVPRTQALEPYQPLKSRLITLLTLSLLVTALGAVWVARTVSRPIRTLLDAAERITRGNYERAVAIEQTDELGSLAQAFDRMQEAVRDREARIVHQAYHDDLTGLPNRPLARDRLKLEIERAQREHHSVAVIILDCDRFKEINDSLGHEVGDRVLVTVAEQLQAALRASDTVARLGGDEFAVIGSCDGFEEAMSIAKRIEQACSEPLDLGTTTLRVQPSMGLALYPNDGKDVEVLLRRADIAMYAAKKRGDRVAIYEYGWDEHHQRQLGLAADLRTAVDQDQLTLEFQPQVDLRTGEATHIEALLRWDHPHLGRVPPGEFIPLAEHAGYIRALTRWVLDRVVRQCEAWRAEGLDLCVSINISALDLIDGGLPDHVRETLTRYDVPADCITLEVTESAVMQDAMHARGVLQGLQDVGVRISIDDFGTGHSSLAQLRRLPVDELKIDKSFILDLTEAAEDDGVDAIVRSAIELGHNMGLSVVAEGVETPFSQECLKRYRCDYAQGFLFSRPMPAHQVRNWILQKRKAGT